MNHSARRQHSKLNMDQIGDPAGRIWNRRPYGTASGRMGRELGGGIGPPTAGAVGRRFQISPRSPIWSMLSLGMLASG